MNKKFTGMAIVIVMMAISCKKFLTIDPQFEFASTAVVTSLDGLSKTTVGEFNQLQSGNLYGGGIIANSEVMADFVIPRKPIADYSLLQLLTRTLNSQNGVSSGMWGDAYRAIYMANTVLKYAPNFTSQNAAQVNIIKGQSFFVRGIMHFELLRMFAQPSGFTSDDSHLGIPIVLAPGDVSHGQSIPRSTVAQCYTQIKSDLDSAYILLGSDNLQYAAAAFLTRVYFTEHIYDSAKYWANIVINSGQFALNTDVVTVDSLTGQPVGTQEAVFQQISYYGAGPGSSSSDINNSALTGNFTASFKNPAQYGCSTAFQTYYEADSAAGGQRAKRLYAYVKATLSGSSTFLFTKKYNDPNMNVPIIRLAEIYLTRAECSAQLGSPDDEVRSDYNLIRVRGGLVADNTTSGKQALLNAIWAQRDYELAYEGDRFFEIKRRQISFIAPETGQSYSWNSPQLVYPIPLQEVQQNKNMVQNTGY